MNKEKLKEKIWQKDLSNTSCDGHVECKFCVDLVKEKIIEVIDKLSLEDPQ